MQEVQSPASRRHLEVWEADVEALGEVSEPDNTDIGDEEGAKVSL